MLRLTAFCSLLLTALFVLFFDRAKHDPAFSGVSPFSDDPYDAVGSFGVQLGIACAILSLIRAKRTNLKTESLYNRYTYTLRAVGVTQLAIIVTMLADIAALVRFPSVWSGTTNGILLVSLAGVMLMLASGFCFYVILLAKRREVCAKNPLGLPQVVPFVIVLLLLGVYPAGWRGGVAGSILTAFVGMVFLLYSVTILSKAMFPCPDIPERDLVDDITGIVRSLIPRAESFLNHLDLRKREWNLVALVTILLGILVALAEILGKGPNRDTGRMILIALAFIGLESAGVFLGYGLLKRFLGLVRSAPEPRD